MQYEYTFYDINDANLVLIWEENKKLMEST
jgi:hypothetical protein